MADTPVGYDGNPLGPANGGSTPTNSNDFMKQLAAALAAVAGGVGGRALANGAGNPLTSAVPPELSSMLQQANARQAYQNPLFQATTQGVYDMLPDFAKKGTQLTGTLGNSVPAASGSPASSGPGVGTAAGIGGLAGLAALISKAAPGSDLDKAFALIKSHFGGADPTAGGLIQGNKPLPGGTGFPDVPVAGGASNPGGMSSIFPGYFTNPNGSTVEIPGDPANGGGYGGGFFGGQGDTGDPRHD